MQISASTPKSVSSTIPMSSAPTTAASPPDSEDDPVTLNRVSDLVATLQSTPPVRPEAVARGMALAANPDYPPAEIIDKLSSLILDSAAGA